MGNYKTKDLLFRSKGQKIRLVDVNVNTNAPKGIRCTCRHSAAADAAAKYSTIGLILDMIFLDGTVVGKESDTSIYTKFEYKDKVYEATFDGENITWATPEPEGYAILIPVVVYTLSNLFSGDDAEELKGYFDDIKKSKDKNSVLLFCDAFYYAYAKPVNHEYITSFANELPKYALAKGLENGIFQDIPLMDGLWKGIKATAKAAEVDEEEEKEEDFTIKYDGWTEEQKKNIPGPNTLKTFVMTDKALSIARKIKYRMDKVINRMNEGKEGVEAIGPDYVNILMVGRPATGKTALANAVAAMTGMPIYTVPFSKHTEEDTAEGKNKVVEGKIGFVETDFLKAYQNGGIVVCEEINLADPGVVMGSLGQAIEKPFIVMKDGYQPVRRHPLCVIIGTMNTGTAGSRQLNQALSSRFKCTYTLNDPDKNTFVNILTSQGYAKRDCRYVYDAYSKIINYLKDPKQSQEELCDNITLRGCFGALECMEEGQSAKEALTNTLVGKIAEVDLEAAQQVEIHVIECLPEKSR